MSKRRVKCTCGTRVSLPKGEPLPTCPHIAQTSTGPAGGWAGPADYFQFFTPRLPKRAKGPPPTPCQHSRPSGPALPPGCAGGPPAGRSAPRP